MKKGTFALLCTVIGGAIGSAATYMATRPPEDLLALSMLLQEHPGTIVQMDNAIIGSLPNTGNLFLLTAPAMVRVHEEPLYEPLPCSKAPKDAPFCTDE